MVNNSGITLKRENYNDINPINLKNPGGPRDQLNPQPPTPPSACRVGVVYLCHARCFKRWRRRAELDTSGRG